MLNVDDLLLVGESQLGHYQISIVRHTPNGWSPTVPPLDVLVTNYRLILHPQTRRPYPPASIPSNYITHVSDVDLGNKPGLKISLKTGHKLYVLASWSQNHNLTDSIKMMLTSPIGKNFKLNLAQRDLNRLIHFIEKL